MFASRTASPSIGSASSDGDSNVKDGVGGQVLKFDANGTLLLSLGKKGVLAEDPKGAAFVGPTGVAVAANGDVFVTDGHGANAKGNYRVVRFAKDGTFVKTWGKTGTAAGELRDPHAIAIDSQGRLFVADRGNGRVQIFDHEGRVRSVDAVRRPRKPFHHG
jgi:hypothetical protein